MNRFFIINMNQFTKVLRLKDKKEIMEVLGMADKIKYPRREKVVNSILDAGVEDIQKIGVEATHVQSLMMTIYQSNY